MRILLAAILFITSPLMGKTPSEPIFCYNGRFHPVEAKQSMVSSEEEIASRIGQTILDRGGNAADAAIAVAFALAVTLPRAGNLGGGGFMLLHMNGETHVVDYREIAPEKANREMFLDEDGEVVQNLSRFHGLSVGVPGTVAGMALVHERWGSLPWCELLRPAIQLAEEGIEVSYPLARVLGEAAERFARFPSSKKIFLKQDGSKYAPGDLFTQHDLAYTLEVIAEEGPRAFYCGAIGRKIVEEVQQQGGILSCKDLYHYKPVVRKPLWGSYHGYKIASVPPPSSGGVHVIQILNLLEEYPLAEMGHNSAATIHLMTETMKRAYADRSRHLGDSDFVAVPIEGLLSKEYARDLRKKISLEKATPATEIQPGNPSAYESPETTHFSVVDCCGNAVSNTYTLNFSFGSGIVAEGTGILLNNQMDDFSAKPGTPNAYGMVGEEANAVEAGKRPLSSMSPTMVFAGDRPYLLTGSPGGSRIISAVVQVIVNVLDHEMNLAEASNAPRIHHQWLPDELYVEGGVSIDTMRLLEEKGHKISPRPAMGSTQSIQITPEGLFGSSDPRRPGAFTVGR